MAAQHLERLKQAAREKILSGRGRESQYAEDYLRGNAQRGDGRGLSLKSYLAYCLRGNAKSYMRGYYNALYNSMLNREFAGLARQGRSQGGSTAWYPVEPEVQA